MLVIEAPQQRRASLAVLAGGLHLADSAAADETQNQGKQNRTHGGDHNADEHALRRPQPVTMPSRAHINWIAAINGKDKRAVQRVAYP